MKRHFVRVLALAGIALLTSQTFVAQAQGQRSPSVRAAARLKHNPPPGWIRHYLPEDRYKILGGTWKFVSTELDRFYYPAWAPEMLRQRASRVIGFSSAEDAQEAGYLPGGGYANVDPGFDRANALLVTTRTEKISNARVNRGNKPIRVLLSDGASSVLLPPGWERVQLGASTFQSPQGAVQDVNDMIRPITRRGGYVLIGANTMPPGTNAQEQLNQMEQMIAMLGSLMKRAVNQSGVINNQVSTATDNIKTSKIRWAGHNGIVMRQKDMPAMAGNQMVMIDNLMVIANKNKLYMAGTRGSGGGSASRTVINSFRPG